MDDTKLELNIILPPNHPLGTVTVEPGQHAGGTANWRNCHMQLSIFLMHQVWNLNFSSRQIDKLNIKCKIFVEWFNLGWTDAVENKS